MAHSNPMIRKISIAAVAIALIGLVGFCILAWRPAIAPLERRPDPASFRAEAIARGEILSAEGHCVSCHIQPGGQPFAGGYGVNTPFGVIYGTNITPDTQTGIGRWSLPAFTRAMREGVSRDGHHLYAAFPYTAFTRLSDDDISAALQPALALVEHVVGLADTGDRSQVDAEVTGGLDHRLGIGRAQPNISG